VAILSGNTDLLNKARLDKKIAAFESERKSFAKNKSSSICKLNDIERTVKIHTETVACMKDDRETLNGRIRYDADGNKLNPLKLDGVESTDIKVLAAKLGQINDNASTHGDYQAIGELYGFRLSVKTEESQKEGILFRQNRFFVEGGGHVKYDYNNGYIANDPKLAVNYFIHALEKIPTLIANHEKKITDLSQDLPVLQEVANSTWRKEDELKALKLEAASLGRKIQLSLKPIDEDKDKQQNETPEIEVHKESPKVPIVPNVPTVPNNSAAHIETIQALFSGKTHPSEIKSTFSSYPIPNRLQEYKETMGDRLIIGSIPKYDYEKQTKGMKL
jgi:hypothetical protein